MKKLSIAILLLLLATLASSQSASAHVLTQDAAKTKGAIVHIIPDDDPVAGKEATLYFDIQGELSSSDSSVQLSITNANGTKRFIPTTLEGSLASATYTFPTQGAYNLALTVSSNGTTYIFSQPQRVSRGVTTNALDQPTYAWAEILLLASGIGFVMLIFTAFNRKRDIAEYSTF